MRIVKGFIRAIPLATLGVVIGLAGCKTVNTVERQTPVGVADPVPDKRVSTDKDVDAIANILQVRQVYLEGSGLLKIEVDVLNKRSSTQTFNYKFDWLDDKGMHVNTPTSVWTSVALEGGETKAITGIAPNNSCKDFRLSMQESKK